MQFQVRWTAAKYAKAKTLYRRLHPWHGVRLEEIVALAFVAANAALLAGPARLNWDMQSGLLVLEVLAYAGTTWRLRLQGRRMAAQSPLDCIADASGLRIYSREAAESYPWPEFSLFQDSAACLLLTRNGGAAPVLLPTDRLSATEKADLLRLLRAHVADGDASLKLLPANG